MEFNDTEDTDYPFPNVEEDGSSYYKEIFYLAMNIIIFILGLSAIVTDILIICFISKFKRLKSRVNSYIMHYAILNILFFVGLPIIRITHWILLELLNVRLDTYHLLGCLETQTDRLWVFLSFLFAFALSFDWWIMVYKPQLGLKIKTGYRYIIIIIYFFGGFNFGIQSYLCFTQQFNLESTVIFTTYCIILLFTLVLDYLNYRYKSSLRNKKNAYSLTIANVILLSWLPRSIYIVLKYTIHNLRGEIMIRLLYYIPMGIAISTSIFVLIALYKTNKYVRMAFAKLFKRSVNRYNNEEENLDESDDDNSETTGVTYNKNTQSINTDAINV